MKTYTLCGSMRFEKDMKENLNLWVILWITTKL